MLRYTLTLTTLALMAMPNNAAIGADQDAERAERFRIEARIAAEQGDFATALSRIHDAATATGDRVTAERTERFRSAAQPAGGSPFANFGEIIQLIQDQTTPPARWITTDGEGGTISISQQGVLVTSSAVLSALASIDDDTHLLEAAEQFKQANHNRDVRHQSGLRMVSLPRLEAHVADLLSRNLPVPEDVQSIAGLTRIDYLFVFPETGDVVIAGPAGDWRNDASGRNLNSVSGRPTLNLDDLIVLNRTFGRSGAGGFVCTIDPKQQHVAAVQEFVKANRRSLNPATAAQFTQQLEQRLGLQNVEVQGVPANSRIASVIVEADYRMKEIGIGRRSGAPGMKSYFDLLTRSEQRGSGSMDALRWWMAVGYDAINVSSNEMVFEFAGNAIRCLSENQVVANDGQRTGTGKASRANAKFARLFSQHLPELAKQDPVFADLENVFDLAMVTALVQSHGIGTQIGWEPSAFTATGLQPEAVAVPAELMSAAHFRVYDGRHTVIQVAGGVRANVTELIQDRARLQAKPALDAVATTATPIGQQNGHWWWDARQTSEN